jgi:hypothetical protein
MGQGTPSPVNPLAYGTGVNPCQTPAYGTKVRKAYGKNV